MGQKVIIPKKINNNNLEEIKQKLINEAKSSEFYKKEYDVIIELEKSLEKANKDVYNSQKIIGETNREIHQVNIKLEALNKRLDSIKDIYLDMHEDY